MENKSEKVDTAAQMQAEVEGEEEGAAMRNKRLRAEKFKLKKFDIE